MPVSKINFKTVAGILIVLLGLYIFVMQMWSIHTLWTPVGFVDTWPLFHRLMKYTSGQMSLDHYLLDPHVHPHLIVYFLYLIDVTLFSGRQVVPHLATMLSILGLVTVIWVVVWRFSTDHLSRNLSIYVFFIGTLILLSGINEATAIPFQTVVITTRFIYILLLAILVFCQFHSHKVLHLTALLASVVAVSFYASGGIFAAEIIMLHLLFYRRWRWLLASFLPLLTYLLIVRFYMHPSAETDAIKVIFNELNITTIAKIGLGSISYYSTALVGGWPTAPDFTFNSSKVVMLLIGFIVCATTVCWSTLTMFRLLSKVWRRDENFELNEFPACLMALVSIWVFVSSLSAALLWIARSKIFGAAMGMPVHYAVLTSNRYAAFSSLAFMVFLFIAMKAKNRLLGSILSSFALVIVVVVGLNSFSDQKMRDNLNYYRNANELAATAFLMGISPADHEGSAVWPGVDKDWYWAAELPKVVAYLKANNLSYANGLPLLGQGVISSWPTTIIASYEVHVVAEKPQICLLNGNATIFRSDGTFLPQRFFTVSNASGKIIGYALHPGNDVNGHIFCDESQNHQQLFLSRSN